MAVSSQKFQAPKGTRDFYPADLAVRRHIENVWRQVSINHGFEEIDGPTFEHLELYTHKSGPGIASELFQVMSGKDEEQIAAIRAGGAAPFALRPEFTPTLARMVAAKAAELPRPIKWFAIPSHFRAERPQRGRLREFMQWNVDFIGDDSPRADAEVIATAVMAFEQLGLTPGDVRVHISDRRAIAAYLTGEGIAPERHPSVFDFLDRSSKLPQEEFAKQAESLGLKAYAVLPFAGRRALDVHVPKGSDTLLKEVSLTAHTMHSQFQALEQLFSELKHMDLEAWCDIDVSIVRGLAYYTGTVFEIHEATGAERAIAGGGRYDNLIESFGGPKLAACGFGMGDVVLANTLRDKGLLKPEEEYLPRPDAFVIAADDDAAAKMPAIVAQLRKHDLHIRQSYKTTRNVGKLLGDASKCRARFAVILGKKLAENIVELKNMDGGEQREIALSELANALKRSP
jgi:histidyl-tRNA synthetase